MEQIIHLFRTQVKGVPICMDGPKHCGKEGHWLESRMGISPNSRNEPDLFGYEMKKGSPKTTLGDFSASEYAFSKKEKERSYYIKLLENNRKRFSYVNIIK